MSTNKKIIVLDSSQKTFGTTGDFYQTLRIPQNNEWKKISLVSASIPKSWYMITTLDKFQLRELAGPILTPIDVQLTANRNYTIDELVLELQSMLNSLSPNGNTYVVVFQPYSGKLNINCVQGDFSFTYSSPLASLPKYLGFPPLTSSGGNMISTGICILQRYEYVQVRLNNCLNNNDNVLANILSSNKNYFDIIEYESNDPEILDVDMLNSNNDQFHVTITDPLGNPINFNNTNIHMVLACYE